MRSVLLPLFALLTACSDASNPEETNEGEVITTVSLTFTPNDGSAAVTSTWEDLEGDGSPVVDEVVLSNATDYTFTVSFLNALEDPAEDITAEVAAEDDQHQVFFSGSAVSGPATGDDGAAPTVHAYADTDANGLPVGLDNTLATRSVGEGTFTVTLRHLPPEGGVATKVEGLAEDIAAGGFSAIPGDSDVSVDFALSVQ
jgi:hypothetical protein